MKKVLLTTLVVALTGAILFTGAAYAGPGHPGPSPSPGPFPKPPVYLRADITKAWITGIAAGETVKWIRWAWAYGPGELPTTVTITDIKKDGVSILWFPETVPGSSTSHWCHCHYPSVPGTGTYLVTFDAAWGTGASAVHKTYQFTYVLLT